MAVPLLLLNQIHAVYPVSEEAHHQLNNAIAQISNPAVLYLSQHQGLIVNIQGSIETVIVDGTNSVQTMKDLIEQGVHLPEYIIGPMDIIEDRLGELENIMLEVMNAYDDANQAFDNSNEDVNDLVYVQHKQHMIEELNNALDMLQIINDNIQEIIQAADQPQDQPPVQPPVQPQYDSNVVYDSNSNYNSNESNGGRRKKRTLRKRRAHSKKRKQTHRKRTHRKRTHRKRTHRKRTHRK